MARFNPGRCEYCGKPFQKPQPNARTLKRYNPTIDHLYPQVVALPTGLRDWNDPKNKHRACHECNGKKGHIHPLTWLTIMPSDACAIRIAEDMMTLGEDRYAVGFAMGKRQGK